MERLRVGGTSPWGFPMGCSGLEHPSTGCSGHVRGPTAAESLGGPGATRGGFAPGVGVWGAGQGSRGAGEECQRGWALRDPHLFNAMLKSLLGQQTGSINCLPVIIGPPARAVNVNVIGSDAKRLRFDNICYISI